MGTTLYVPCKARNILTALLLGLVLQVIPPISSAIAALGEDEATCIKHYGPYTERGTVNRKADYTLHWNRKDRIITAAFIDGKCEMITYAMKDGAGNIPQADIEAAMQENAAAGQTWKQRASGSASWMRSDDKATAVHMDGLLIISTRDYLARRPRS